LAIKEKKQEDKQKKKPSVENIQINQPNDLDKE